MLLRNARISGSDGEPVDVSIFGGVIDDIGMLDSMLGRGESIDLEGRWVSPGLWDNHVHFTQWTLAQQRLDISEATSARHAAQLIGSALMTTAHAMPEGVSFVAAGFRDGLWPDVPNLADLDAVAPNTPVAVLSGDLHSIWLNTVALGLYGLAGHPTGLLVEDDAFAVTRRIDSVPDQVLDPWAAEAAQAAAARGVVGIVDLEMDWNLDTWQRRMTSGTSALRVEFGIYTQHLDRAAQLGLRTGDAVTELLSVGRYKVLTDGSLNTRTAYCFDEYPGMPGEFGMLTMPPADLMPHLRMAVAAGIEPTVHAIGDHAVSLALDAFEALGTGGSMEHAQLIANADIPRFASLGVTASVQPDHAMDDRDVAEHYWPGRTGRAFALRSLLDAGATLAMGSDAPVSPLDPWVTAAAAVTRTRGEREPWHPEQRISAAEALAASTRSTVEVGQPADLVLTETDPLAAVDLRSVSVAATLLGGGFTFDTTAG